MARLFDFSLEEQIACLERELKLRAAVYPRLIQQKQMSREKAEHEYACLRSVLHMLTNTPVPGNVDHAADI